MQQKISLKLLLSEAANPRFIQQAIAQTTGSNNITGFHILKKSIDARSRTIWVNLTVQAFINEPFTTREQTVFDWKPVTDHNTRVVIIGAGPAGLFAALRLLEIGIKPIILERGKDVRARRRDLARLNRDGIVDPESNYCFGEGGAGTYSDGKLYTRSSKRGDIGRILSLFVHFGAEENILYEAHPHIGTNKLPQIITAMRERIIAAGGEFHFGQKADRFETNDQLLRAVHTQTGDRFEADHFILATGHSARDIFSLLAAANLSIEAKPFALGVRIEHPQQLIDSIQYHCVVRDALLPPAAYTQVEQVNARGVFSFCMCPGGIIAPAATDAGELVVNGWSPSKRNNAFANSGIVVQVEIADAITALRKSGIRIDPADTLALMYFQQWVERSAFAAGGGSFQAPAQRMADFVARKTSVSLPQSSYIPGLSSVSLDTVLPPFIYEALSGGFAAFGKKMRGYFTNEAVVVATESRTSSPVRIPRNSEKLHHPQLLNLFPCGEGAGYAGGIVSAAMDGERVANAIGGQNYFVYDH
jgi:uncharacterized protein